MTRYSFDGIPRTRWHPRSRIAALALLCCAARPAPAHAVLSAPDVLRIADGATADAALLSPAEVQEGLRIRVQDLEVRHQMRTAREKASDTPRDYRLDQPPPDADVPLPADASGGEIFEERLEGVP